MKVKVLKALKASKGEFISGQALSESLDVSRTSISNYMNQLKKDGYNIESISRRGHRLISSPDILTKQEIDKYLETDYIGQEIHYYQSVTSTNLIAKDFALKENNNGVVIISEEQTQGKGRLGRSWISPNSKGIWMSLVVKPKIDPMDASKITQITAASIYKALSEMKIETYIKWPNDIILNDKKICGILTEMTSEMMQINYMVVGIGINANLESCDIPKDLENKASSLLIETGQVINRKRLVGKILNHFEYYYNQLIKDGDIREAIEICRDRSILIGKEIRVIEKKEEFKRFAVGLTDRGELIVKDSDGKESVVVSGEVSVRGKYGYV